MQNFLFVRDGTLGHTLSEIKIHLEYCITSTMEYYAYILDHSDMITYRTADDDGVTCDRFP